MAPAVIIGFISIDFIGHVDALPVAGVPRQATDLDVACGGRAANQAMALAAIEGEVALLARIGEDEHAAILMEEIIDVGIDASNVIEAPSATGLRLTALMPDGSHGTVVYRGANDYLTVDDLNRRGEVLTGASVVAATTEPAGAVSARALELARTAGVTTVLTHEANPKPVGDKVLAAADVVVTSDATCTGLLDPTLAREQPEAAARALVQRGPGAVILLSRDRAILATADGAREVASPGRLDTEDAVDAFVAGMIHGLMDGEELEPAVLRGVRTSCLLVE